MNAKVQDKAHLQSKIGRVVQGTEARMQAEILVTLTQALLDLFLNILDYSSVARDVSHLKWWMGESSM